MRHKPGKPVCKHRWVTLLTQRTNMSTLHLTYTLHIMECRRCWCMGTKVVRAEVTWTTPSARTRAEIAFIRGLIDSLPAPIKKRGIP